MRLRIWIVAAMILGAAWVARVFDPALAHFGDHGSPISATTVLASVGADCPQFEHV